jgi:hypothetical protein
MRKLAFIPLGALLGVLMFSLPAAGTQAASTPASVSVYSPKAHAYGHSYRQWAVQYYKWVLTSPANQVPWADHTGQLCTDRQSGPVWFLTSNSGGTDVRSCTVPAGKAILVPPANWECSTLEGNGTTYAALNQCADGYAASLKASAVTVDGVQLKGLLTSYLFENLFYTFAYSPRTVMGQPSNATGISKSAGFVSFVILKPLPPGRHTVDISFTFAATPAAPGTPGSGEVVYHLNVRR